MAITLRAVTGSALSHNQLDTNFSSLFYSASVSASVLNLHYTGSAAIGQPPSSVSVNLPSSSKWSDIAGGGISRNSTVQISGSTSISGSTNIFGNLTQGFSGLQAYNFSHAEGYYTIASGAYSHAEGYQTATSGNYSHAEGRETSTAAAYSHAEGYLTIASASYSHAEGFNTQAIGFISHTEGSSTTTYGNSAHAEGLSTIARGDYSHTEGVQTITSGSYSHAEGYYTIARGVASHAEGYYTIASGSYSHAEGSETIAIGTGSHAEGFNTVASGSYQHVQGQYNISSSASGSIFQVTGSLNVAGAINTVGNLTVQGNITAQQYIVSSSVYYVTESFSSGSHIFGNSLDDTHQFTGSVLITGSLSLRNGAQGAGYILTSDVNGASTWSPSFAIESIVTTTDITTETTGSAGLSQRGRCVIIDNGANNINLTVNGSAGFTSTYIKHGSGSVSFVEGSGRTLIPVDGTLVLNGTSGSTATVISYSTSDYLRVNNA